MPPFLPLRVAFFGSDAFSLASLKTLVSLKHHTPLISHIDVFTRSPKPKGRHRVLTDVPLGVYSTAHGLPLLRVDSAAEIKQHSHRGYDLAVTVSFGKLIPAAFLSLVRYGGLNVHPSFLPRFSGSSPIQYAIMNDCHTTGVSVQTLHPTKFDHGDILRQSLPVEIGRNERFESLRDRLSIVGADLLSTVIRNGEFVHPQPIVLGELYLLSPKIPATLAEVRWNEMTSRQICRLEHALGPLFSYKSVDITKKMKHHTEPAKVILGDIQEVEPSFSTVALEMPGEFCLHNDRIVVKTTDSHVSIGSLTFQCCNAETPEVFIRKLKLRAGETRHAFHVST